MPLPLPRSNRRRRPDSRVRVVLVVSKARLAPVDRVCPVVRMVSRVCLAVRVAPAVSKARVVLVVSKARAVLVVSKARAAPVVSKARAAPVDKVCLAVRMVSRVCPVVRVAPAVSKARAARALRTDPPRRGPRIQLQRRRRQRTLLKALTPKTLIPLLSNEGLPVGVLDATMAPGRPYFFS